ncbi:MAG TPA: redoxin domain-containing protein [Candidatus Eisenbergiella merdipullorum]|uniref:Redoxin domain-containing protein n=1 Tax=Candidatus Eisenbergiella merdipullorum TaxID=2838553 RepID=A0A9D2I5L4_9FIRM|nr:redoxin domain-containing protein [Candidatus Eisenbergiella merdipullorum]
MNLTVETGVPVITVFLQGLLSFFSPCVLPLVPLYVSYLAGGAQRVDADGNVRYPRKKILVNTLFFVAGISFTFFLLGFGFTALGRFFTNNRAWFARISGIIMIFFGLYQLGLFGRSEAIEREHRLPFRLDRFTMNPFVALILGFTFSFAWTPCVGPALASVLLMASSSATAGRGYLLVGVYTLGFVLPFLAVGLFTGAVLDFFRRKRNVVRYTVKIGAVLLILMGIMTLTGFMNGITGYLSRISSGGVESSVEAEPSAGAGPSDEAESSGAEEAIGSESSEAEETREEQKEIPALDFTLTDQYGQTHTFSDYKGKTVFLNFWATWCPPCKSEMPDIQALYEKYGENEGDLIVLGVANPKTNDMPGNQDGTVEEVTDYLEENKITFPVVMDTTGELFYWYGISAFPTTFMIDRNGNVYGYVTGALTADMMESIVTQTMESVE